ncbi:MAG TPA: hypothetical protein VGP48_05325 [Stellaceae bacterium]|jgi:hypothetical protein|nr:hypothetical protein [Stellaceae bacterium]
MDISFGRILEMFEERFGRVPTTLLLAIIGLAIFASCGKLIYEIIIDPTYSLVLYLIPKLVSSNLSVTTLADYITPIVALVGTALSVVGLFFAMRGGIGVYVATKPEHRLQWFIGQLDYVLKNEQTNAALSTDTRAQLVAARSNLAADINRADPTNPLA